MPRMSGKVLLGLPAVSTGAIPFRGKVPSGSRSARLRCARYPIALPVQYRVNGFTRSGITTHISSSGMFIATREVLPVNQSIKVTIDWPAVLDGRCPLGLVVLGRVRRINGRGMEIAIEQYEFRLRRGPRRERHYSSS